MEDNFIFLYSTIINLLRCILMEVTRVEKGSAPETCFGLTAPSLAHTFTLHHYPTLEGAGTERQWQKWMAVVVLQLLSSSMDFYYHSVQRVFCSL